MHSTDLQVLANLAPVAKQLLEQGGFTVDMQSMDWQTLVSRRAKKEPPAEGGWNALPDLLGRGRRAQPDQHRRPQRVLRRRAWFGWPCDEQIEQMRAAFAERDRSGQADRARRSRSRRARSRSAPTPMSASGTSRSPTATPSPACCTARRRSSGTSARASERLGAARRRPMVQTARGCRPWPPDGRERRGGA